uniref:Uncharacterized protein n=1 Tax=Anopheles atroparvus TaxID=41427 RepID=A0A182J0H5_ANOAO
MRNQHHPPDECYEGQNGELHLQRGGPSQTALERVIARLLVVHDVLELGLDQLPVVVGDQILVRILETLSALAFVAARFVPTAQDRHTLQAEGMRRREREKEMRPMR